MENDSSKNLDKHKKLYFKIGILLFIFTGLTLALGKIDFLDFGPPGPTPSDYVIGLALATSKASLVAIFFMHLNHEKILIYKILVFTFWFSVALMGLTLFAKLDPVDKHYEIGSDVSIKTKVK